MFRERERERERERVRERERERERRNKQKPGALVNLIRRFLFFSHQSPSRNLRSRMKTHLRLGYSFPMRPATSRSYSLRTDKTWSVCMTVCLDGNGNSWTWSPMLRLDSNFPQRVDNWLASNRKDQVTECLFEQLLLHFKEKSDGDNMVRHKSSKLKTHNEKSICWSNDSCRKLAEYGLTGNACTAAIASRSTALHGNNAVN